MLYMSSMVALAISLGVMVITLTAWVRIITKAGYSGWWVLVSLVPFLNFVMFLVFAFSRWPVQRQQEAQRARQVADLSGGGNWAPTFGGGPAFQGSARASRSWDYLG
jgi:uncharacterized membrane protein